MYSCILVFDVVSLRWIVVNKDRDATNKKKKKNMVDKKYITYTSKHIYICSYELHFLLLVIMIFESYKHNMFM